MISDESDFGDGVLNLGDALLNSSMNHMGTAAGFSGLSVILAREGAGG